MGRTLGQTHGGLAEVLDLPRKCCSVPEDGPGDPELHPNPHHMS